MNHLQSNVTTYTVTEKATRLYNGVVDIFDWRNSSDVVTPYELALKQVRELPTHMGNVLIPGAGIGTYILALLQEGFKPEQITAIELDPAYSRLGYGIFSRFGVHYVTADFLLWQSAMKFDVVIGNPPYQKSKYSDFYVCFMRKAVELLKDGGYFSMIAPSKGAQPGSRAQKPLKELGWNFVEFGIESYFPNIGTVIAQYCGVKGSSLDTLELSVKGTRSTVQKGTVFPLTSRDQLAYSIVAKIFSHESKLPFVRQKEAPKGKYLYVSRIIGTWHPAKIKGGSYALKAYKCEAPEQNDGGFIICQTEEQVERANWAVTRSLVMLFAVNQCGRAAFIPPMFWSLSPDILECSSDEETFDMLGFTAEEVDYINKWAAEVYK